MSSTQTAICTNSALQWTFNSLKQSPCVIAGYLGGACNAGQFNVPPLSEDRVYLGPVPETANPCRCSSVFYSLIAACSACQSRDWLKWSSYNRNCSTVYPGLFPGNIPSGTTVPHYAFIDVVRDDTFNITSARGALDFPESSAVPQSTGTSASTTTTGLPSPTNTPSSSSSNAGAIAGGVVGGVVLLAIVAALIFWWTRRRRNNNIAPSSMMNAGYNAPPAAPPTASTPMKFNSSQPLTTMPAPRLYDPSDPSTYPSTAATSDVFTPAMRQQSLHPNHSGSTYYSAGHAPPNSRYTGAPEL